MRPAQMRYEQTLRVLNNVALALQQARTPEEVYDAAAKEMTQLGYHIFILVLSRDRKHLRMERLSIGASALDRAEQLTGLSADTCRIPMEILADYQEVLDQREAVLVPSLVPVITRALPVSVRPLVAKIAEMLILHRGVLAPLVVTGQVNGILVVSSEAMAEADVPIVTVFADQISAALERARLFAELQEREWRATVAYEIAQQYARELEDKVQENVWLLEREQERRLELDQLNNALRLFASQLQECRDEAAIAQLLCSTVCDELGWKRAIVSLCDYDRMTSRVVARVGYPPGGVEEQMSLLLAPCDDSPWMQEEFQVSYSYYVPDASTMLGRGQMRSITESRGEERPPDLLVVPLEAGGRMLGMLSPAEREGERPPSRQQIEHLELFAAQAAIAIEGIRLSKSVRMWADAVRHSGDAILITDLEGRILSVNPALEELSGYRQEELVGQNTRILNSGLTPPDVFTEMWNTVLGGGIWRGEVINRRKDGSIYDADLTAAPILDEGGEIIGLIGSQRDITRIRELDRLKTQFVSNVSHELRTPLTNIKLYQRYLRERRRPDLQDRFFDILDRETNRLMQMIESLLDLSRLEAGTMPFDSEPLDLNELIGKVVADYGVQAKERGLTLAFVPATRLPRTMAGRNQIIQAITNLLTNALNYTPSGGRVRVTTDSAEAGVLVRVRDTGYGIAPEEMDQIFERFYRGEAARKAEVPGTGLGLAIVKQILDLHGGSIQIESEVGEGTTVTITLPAMEVAVTPPAILLVEDDPDILFLIQQQLEDNGYRVTPVTNGEAALEQLAQGVPDLMVLDLLLPKMDGLEVLEHLQTGGYGPVPPILVITGADPVLAHRSLTLGASDFLTKPYSPQVFLDVVRRLLQSRQQA